MFCMTCCGSFFIIIIFSVIDFIGQINIGVSLIACLCVLLFYQILKMGEESAQKTSCKSYRKNGPTVPSGGGEKTLRAAKKRMQ